MLEEFLDKSHQHFDSDYVVVKIDIQNMAHGKKVAGRIRKISDGGIPWMVILKSNGDELITSDGPNGNIGYPFQPDEIEHFMTMLTKSANRLTTEKRTAIETALNENAHKIKEKQKQRQSNSSEE